MPVNDDFGTQVGQALQRIDAGQESPQDYALIRQALLHYAPSSTTYRHITKALENAPMPGTQGLPASLPAETAPVLPGIDAGIMSGAYPGPANPVVTPPGNTAPGIPVQNPKDPVISFPNQPSMKDQPLMGDPHAGMEQFGYDLPEGYSFSDMGPQAVAAYNENPNAYLTNYAETKGGGANMASFLQDPYKSALAMSRMGMLGGGYGDDLFAGQGLGSAAQLAHAENFLNDYSQPGNFVDPQAIMQDVVSRGARTNFEGMADPHTGLPYTPQDIINITNAAISSSAAFMAPEGKDWLDSILQAKGNEYINAIARGEIDANTSYPKWLQQQGIGNIIQGQQ